MSDFPPGPSFWFWKICPAQVASPVSVTSLSIGKEVVMKRSSYFAFTVGAQSIARAQSIAHGHIGDVICQKNENL